MLTIMDSIKEGDGTLLDHSFCYSTRPTMVAAKFHSLEHMPLLTFWQGVLARMKTGIHVAADGDTTSRVGLTVMQALGVPLNSWGTESNQTSRTITEVDGLGGPVRLGRKSVA